MLDEQCREGCVAGSILFRYERSSGDLFVRSCARYLPVGLGKLISDGWICGAGLFRILL